MPQLNFDSSCELAELKLNRLHIWGLRLGVCPSFMLLRKASLQQASVNRAIQIKLNSI